MLIIVIQLAIIERKDHLNMFIISQSLDRVAARNCLEIMRPGDERATRDCQ
jgi:hypothetical protein